MKITKVETLHLRLPDVAEIADGTQDVLVVRLHTDNGLTGIGEVTSQSYVCQACFDAPRSAERRCPECECDRGRERELLQSVQHVMPSPVRVRSIWPFRPLCQVWSCFWVVCFVVRWAPRGQGRPFSPRKAEMPAVIASRPIAARR